MVEEIIAEPKKTNKKLIFAVVFAVLILIGIGVYIAYETIDFKKDKENNETLCGINESCIYDAILDKEVNKSELKP